MDLDEISVQRILDKYNLGKIQRIKKEASGITGDVLRVNNQLILKVDSRRQTHKYRIERNAIMCEILEKNGILAPRTIALDTSKTIIKQEYIILTLLEGDNLIDVWETLPEHEQKSIAFEYGSTMAKIHQIKMEKFGDIVNNHLQYDSWYSFITGRYKKYFKYLEKNRILTDSILNQVKKLFNDNDTLFRVKTEPVLLHADFGSKNIKYYNGRLNGIFDFDESLGGHNEFDFTKVFLPYKVDRYFANWIVEGYERSGNLSSDFFQRVKLYSLGFLLNVLWFSHDSGLITPDLKAKYVGGIEDLLRGISS